MFYIGDQEQAISEYVYGQLMKMMEDVPKDRRDGLYMYVHLDKGVGMNGLVCVNFSGSFFELENGRSKPHYFHPSINVDDVYKMCERKDYHVERDSVGWLKARLS